MRDTSQWPQPTGGFAWAQGPCGAVLFCAPLAVAAAHVFTTASLRLTENEDEWAAVAAQMGVRPEAIRLVRQVHGASVAIVRAGSPRPAAPPEADIVISDDPAAVIGVRVADCVPILLADRRRGVVAAAHAGWRGTVARAAAVAVEALGATFGSRPEDLIAAVGPSLGVCCAEMGPEVRQMFEAAGHAAADLDRWFSPGRGGRLHLDLGRANRDQLVHTGVPPEHVHEAGLCTRTCSTVLHSYRAHGTRAGRMAAMIRARQA